MKKWIERIDSRKMSPATTDEYYYRIDRRRIINSMAFRKLQAKTQVHTIGESDFFRTRLTHSLEVSQIGLSIVERLFYLAKSRSREDEVKWLPPSALIETICLAHDIGHPAFGHNGERTLNYFMHKHGGFEGNGQTLRILTKLGEFSKNDGYNLTRRSLLGVIKYPVTFSNTKVKYKDIQLDNMPVDISHWSPPKCIYDSEKIIFDWVLDPLIKDDKELFLSTKVNKKGGLKSIYKSLDTSIMECADDIAYGLHDIEDAIVTGLIPSQEIIDELKDEIKLLNSEITINYKGNCEDLLKNKLKSNNVEDIKMAISMILNNLINSTSLIKHGMFESPILDYQCVLDSEKKEIVNAFKNLLYSKVISHPSTQTIEFKGQKIISKLFYTLVSNPNKLLPIREQIKLENGQSTVERVVSDYISCMTDNEASKLYQRLFVPDQGSVFASIY